MAICASGLRGDAADNPDQRIADDTKLFVDRTLDIGLTLLNSIVTFVSFVIILWGLSEEAPLSISGVTYAIPGYLVWAALIYSVFGTVLTQWIGAPLVNLDFEQQRREADFRFNLVRTRENAEQIALLDGERAERTRLLDRFGGVVSNWYAIMSRTKRLTAFTASFSQAAVIIPLVLIAPVNQGSHLAKTQALLQLINGLQAVGGRRPSARGARQARRGLCV